jgi:hypothetical protein
MGALSDYVRSTYGVNTSIKTKNVSLVTTAPVVVLENNPNRIAWAIFNLSTGVAYLTFEGIPSATYGIQVNASGGSVSFNGLNDLEIPELGLLGISTGAATTLWVFETVAVY